MANIKSKRSRDRQFAALCYRICAAECGDGIEIELLIITSRETRSQIIPKGNRKRGKPAAMVAAEEAWEEAGIRGKVGKKAIGSFLYTHPDGKKLITRKIEVYPLEVASEDEKWPEMDQRRKSWLLPAEAIAEVLTNPHFLDSNSRQAFAKIVEDECQNIQKRFGPYRQPKNKKKFSRMVGAAIAG